MDKYFYFVAQLPFLKFQDSPPIRKREFLNEAAKWMADKDLKTLTAMSLDDFNMDGHECSIAREYKNFEKNLRKELMYLRDPASTPSGYQIPESLKQIRAGGNPLEAEKSLFLLRWKFLEEQEQDNFFNLEYLKLYFLRLQILERLDEFNKDKGMAVFDQLCDEIKM